VAMLAQGQMIREKEALSVLEADLKELLMDHPISSGREESTEPLNWKVSGRSVPISLFSPWRNDLSPRSAQLIPAKSNEGPWHSRVASALDSATNLERLVILPYHEATPNISGWNASPPSGGSQTQSAPTDGINMERTTISVAASNDDIKRLSDALEHEQNLNERLTAETNRLKQSNQRQDRNRWVALAATGAIALCIGGGAGWMVSRKKAPIPTGEGAVQIQREFGPHQYYWESLAFRSKFSDEAKKFKVYPGEAFLEDVLIREMSVYEATLNTESAGSDFFEWRLKDLKSVLSSHHPSRSLSEDQLCIPCLKYGILNYKMGQGATTDSSRAFLSFNEMNEELGSVLDSTGIEVLNNLLRAMQKGLLSNDGPCVAVRKSIKWTSKAENWPEAAFNEWEGKDEFNFLTGYARQAMIEDLTEYVNPGINDGKQKGDTLVFWVPQKQ